MRVDLDAAEDLAVSLEQQLMAAEPKCIRDLIARVRELEEPQEEELSSLEGQMVVGINNQTGCVVVELSRPLKALALRPAAADQLSHRLHLGAEQIRGEELIRQGKIH